jgi:glycine hydroxymethyltransferase
MLGGSVILFPHPVKEFREIADRLGGYVAYDASHVLGLIAGDVFQDPLREGADLIPSSTHKTFPGPQGAIILTNSLELAEKVNKATFPGLTSNHHLHRVAALAVSLLEMEKYGEAYAKQMVRNAKALAQALNEYGFKVLGEKRGFTESHQVVLDVSMFGGGGTAAKLLEKANIICNKNLLPGEEVDVARRNPRGIRLGTCEVTRLGMGPSEMKQIAEFMQLVLLKKEKPEDIALKVKEFMSAYQKLKYCLTEGEAYKYFKFF